MNLELVSIEVTNRCSKGCAFCYAGSSPAGTTAWTEESLVSFVRDLARHGVTGVSFGGGEPLEFPGLIGVLERTRGLLRRSVTTNGLLLSDEMARQLAETGVERIHVSIHFPEVDAEVDRALAALGRLKAAGVDGGVNLLVRSGNAQAARDAAERLRCAGVASDRLVLLPMRLSSQPVLSEIAQVGGGLPFQAISCLLGCAASPRFCSVGSDGSVGRCSYTQARQRIAAPTYEALVEALERAGHASCGEPLRQGPGRKPLVSQPAAHSMDTDWFAVDEDGHVAEFHSGEAGAVPEAFLGRAGHQYSAEQLYEAALLEPAGGMRLEVADLLVSPDGHFHCESWRGNAEGHIAASQISQHDTCLVWLADESALPALPGFVRVDAGTSHVVACGHVQNIDVVRRLLKDKRFLKGWAGGWLEAERLGFFRYVHDEYDNWASGPYQRVGAPAKPILIDQLCGEAREIASAARLAGICFSQEPRVQPVHHARCSSHQSTFVPAYQDVLLPFERGQIPPVPRGRPDLHVFLAVGLAVLDPADQPKGPHHAGGPLPRLSDQDTLPLLRWLVRLFAPEAPAADRKAVAAIAEDFERFVANPIQAAEYRYGDLDELELAGGPPLVQSLLDAARPFPNDSSFVNLMRQAAAAAVYFNGKNKAGVAGCLASAIEKATMLVAVGAASVPGCPDAAAFLSALDQQLLRVDLLAAFEAWKWKAPPDFGEVLWRAATADGKGLAACIVRLPEAAGEPRYGLAIELGGSRRWFEGPRDDVLSTVPEPLFAAATAAVLGTAR
ncbi:MAG: radical SAM protein [Myxococcales bacterium]